MHCLVKIVIPSVQSRPHTQRVPGPGGGCGLGGVRPPVVSNTPTPPAPGRTGGRWQREGTLSIKIFINEFFQMRNKCVRLVDVNKVRSLHLAALELRIAFVNVQYLPDQLVLVVGAVRTPCAPATLQGKFKNSRDWWPAPRRVVAWWSGGRLYAAQANHVLCLSI